MNAIKALAVGNSAFVPRILVVGGGNNQGVLESLGTMLMDKLDTSTQYPGSIAHAWRVLNSQALRRPKLRHHEMKHTL